MLDNSDKVDTLDKSDKLDKLDKSDKSDRLDKSDKSEMVAQIALTSKPHFLKSRQKTFQNRAKLEQKWPQIAPRRRPEAAKTMTAPGAPSFALPEGSRIAPGGLRS